LNQRVFEVLAAGGLLLTDRLSPESGLELLFQDKRHLALFDSVEHLHGLIDEFLKHRDTAEGTAAAGHAEYRRRDQPIQKIDDLFTMLNGRGPAEYEAKLDRRSELPHQPSEELLSRIAVYELIQDLHRLNSRLRILFWPDLERQACDAVDL